MLPSPPPQLFFSFDPSHANVGAMSSGVPVVPVIASREFNGDVRTFCDSGEALSRAFSRKLPSLH